MLAVTGGIQNKWESKGRLGEHRVELAVFVVLSAILILSLMTMSLAHFVSDSSITILGPLPPHDEDEEEKKDKMVISEGKYAPLQSESGMTPPPTPKESKAQGTHENADDGGSLNPSGESRQRRNTAGTDEMSILADGDYSGFESPSNEHEEMVAAMRVSVREASVWEALKSPDFHLIWIAQFCGTGAGLMTLNNLGQISTALGSSFAIYFGCVSCGLAYGAFWCLNPCLVMEMFGSRSFGSLYSLINLAPAVGSSVFSVGLAASVYSTHEAEGATCCLGQSCYQVLKLVRNEALQRL